MKFIKDIRVPYIARLIFFWLVYFALFRLLFVIYHHAKVPNEHHGETVWAFLYSLPLDISTACWLVLASYILWIVQKFHKTRFVHIANRVINYILIGIVALISIANVKLYGEWGTLISNRVINFMMYPAEVLTFISLWSVLLLLIVLSISIFIGIKLYQLIVANFSAPVENVYFRIGQIIFIACLLFIGIRGGFQLMPINESSSYYSNIQVNNHMAINPVWYLGHSIAEANAKDNPYNFYQNISDAKNETDKLLSTKDSTSFSILKTSKPNIVCIII